MAWRAAREINKIPAARPEYARLSNRSLEPVHAKEQQLTEMRPHPIGPWRISGLRPSVRAGYGRITQMIERQVAALRASVSGAVSTRRQDTGDSAELGKVFSIIPLVELRFGRRIDVH